MHQHFINKFLRNLEKINYGTLVITTPEQQQYSFIGNDDVIAHVTIHNWHVLQNIVLKGDIGFAESYRDGHFDTDNLVNLTTIAIKNDTILSRYIYGVSFIKLASQILYYFRRNTLKGSKKNIHAHYDLGNDFYQLWLDESMTYSSAIFKNSDESLLDAQHNKYDRIINRIHHNIDNVLEIGCGWGGFAKRLLERFDTNIKGITISNEQYDFAKKRLQNKSTIAFEDYRHTSGAYNSIVSIEMFEALGEKFWPIYFNKIRSLLHNNGNAVIQTIVIAEPYFEQYRKSGDIIRSFIFPGGMLPTISRFSHEVEQANMRVNDIFEFGQDYAKTLEQWLYDFEQQLPQLKLMGFDDAFIRMWRMYLSICISGFVTNRTNVIQADISHA